MTHMNYEDSYQRIVHIVETVLSKDGVTVYPTTTFKELGVDTLDLVELIMEIEDQFHCLVDDARVEEVETVGELVSYVQELCKR